MAAKCVCRENLSNLNSAPQILKLIVAKSNSAVLCIQSSMALCKHSGFATLPWRNRVSRPYISTTHSTVSGRCGDNWCLRFISIIVSFVRILRKIRKDFRFFLSLSVAFLGWPCFRKKKVCASLYSPRSTPTLQKNLSDLSFPSEVTALA